MPLFFVVLKLPVKCIKVRATTKQEGEQSIQNINENRNNKNKSAIKATTEKENVHCECKIAYTIEMESRLNKWKIKIVAGMLKGKSLRNN